MQGERPVKSFFDKFKNKRENKPISSLKDKDGNEVFGMKNILRVAEDYYKKLYSTREVSQPIMNLFLNNISPLTTCEAYMKRIMEPFSLEEIWEAICSFSLGKVPGPDGMSVEFYRKTLENPMGNLPNPVENL